jgi:hypothetical protein
VSKPEEYWIDVPGLPHYQVSNKGRVRSMPRTVAAKNRSHFRTAGRVLRPAKSKNGYLTVVCGRGNTRYVHELVLIAFRGPRPGFSTASHLNGTRTDNRLANLAWESAKDNCARQVEHGTRNRGERQGHAQLTESQVLKLRSMEPQRGMFSRMALEWKVSPQTIEDAYKGRTWRHLG